MCIFLFVVEIFSLEVEKNYFKYCVTNILQMKNEKDSIFNAYMEHIHENHDLVPV